MTTILHSIGPTFLSELQAVNLAALPLSWSTSGVYYDETAFSEAQIASLNAVIAAHDPTKQIAVNLFDTGLGWSMKKTQDAQTLFTSLGALITSKQNALASNPAGLAALNTSTLYTILDAENTPRQLPVSQLQQVLAAYGDSCLADWVAANT